MTERRSLPLMERLPGWLVMGVSTLCGIGRIGPAPGTLGALAGTVFVALVLPGASWWISLLWIVALFAVGWLFCDEAEKRLGIHDPGIVIFDEFTAMPIVFWGVAVPANGWIWLAMLAVGFGLFRLFDIAKPFGIARLQVLPGGLGIMIDDVAAALACCGLLHLGAALITL